MENQIVKAEVFGLEENQVSSVDAAFAEKVEERKLLSSVYAEIIKKDINSEVAQEARECRLKAVKIKSGIAAVHKTQKQFALAFGKYCDAWKNKETEPVQQMIDNLLEIEKFEEIQREKARVELQNKRAELLSPYVEDAHERDLAKFEDDEFEALLALKKQQYEDKLEAERLESERLEIERKKNELRRDRELIIRSYSDFYNNDVEDLADLNQDQWKELIETLQDEKAEHEKEQARIKAENERLRKEAEERERLAKIERDKLAKREELMRPYIQFIRKYSELLKASDADFERVFEEIKKGAQDHWEFERKEQLRLQREQEAEERKRRQLERELQAKKQAEEKAKADEAARIEAELNKNDAAKIQDLISDLEALKTKYSFKSAKNKKIYSDVGILIDKVIKHIV